MLNCPNSSKFHLHLNWNPDNWGTDAHLMMLEGSDTGGVRLCSRELQGLLSYSKEKSRS